MSFFNKKNLVFSICLVLLQMLSIGNAGSIRTHIRAEINSKEGRVSKLVNFQRIRRNPTTEMPMQDFLPQFESRADQADEKTTTIESIIPTNEDVVVIKNDTLEETNESSTIPNLAEDTTDFALLPIWDSVKIETSKREQGGEEGESNRDAATKHTFLDRKKEAERLRKVVFHFNRVYGTTAPPHVIRAFPISSPVPVAKQRALGFPLLITNTLENFHRQLDWARFGAFSAEFE